MADETFTQATDAAALLLKLTQELAKPSLEMAKQMGGKPFSPQHAEPCGPIVALEIAGSMAIYRLLASYLKLALPESKRLPPGGGNEMHHLMQAMTAPIVGGVLGFTDDMPPEMQKDFVRLLISNLGDALHARHEGKAKREARYGRKQLSRSSTPRSKLDGS